MEYTYSTVSVLGYCNPEHTAIALSVQFDHLEGPVLFIANGVDQELHGQELYSKALAGDFGVIAPFAQPVPVDPTEEDYIREVQKVLDDAAKSRGYDSMISAASYAGYPNDFQAEALSLATWRSAVWTKCYAVLAEVKAATRVAPTIQELLAELPTLV